MVIVGKHWCNGNRAGLQIEMSGFQPWPVTVLCSYVIRQVTVFLQSLSPPRSINGYRQISWWGTCDGLAFHPFPVGLDGAPDIKIKRDIKRMDISAAASSLF